MARVGEVLHGRYRLDRQIGQGGFAQVFLGADLLLQRYVAIKILNPDLIEQAGEHDFLPRFMTEARAAAALNHPHILTVHDYGQADHLAYLVMPYIDGGTLHDRLRARQPLDVAVVGKYLRQVASALDYAHQRRLVHRDIKPQNMLLRADDDYLFLTDFGIVKVLSAASSQTRTGIMGTVAYMAPEQFQGQVSPATDIYALGCVLFQMLTGQVPFTGPTEQVLYSHLYAPVPSVVESSQRLAPATLQGVIDRALAKQPADRFHSAGELARAFDAAVSAPQSTAIGSAGTGGTTGQPTILGAGPPSSWHQASPTPTQPAATAASLPPARGRRRWLAAALAGAGVLLVLLLALVVARGIIAPGQSAAQATSTAEATSTADLGALATSTASNSVAAVVTEPAPTPAPTPTPEPTAAPTAPPLVDGSAFRGQTVAVLTGHTDAITGLAWSPDGQILASGSFDTTVRLWSADGKPLATLTGHTATVTGLAWSPDGTRLASGSWDHTIRLWSADGKPLATLTGHTDAVTDLAWSPDGATLASASSDATIRLWSADGKPLATLFGHSRRVTRVAWSPDGQHLASASDDRSVRLWSATGQSLAIMSDHTATVVSLAWSPDGQVLASGSGDKTVRLWSADGKALATLFGHGGAVAAVGTLAWSLDGQILASGSQDTTVRLWSADGKPLATLTGHTAAVAGVAWSPDGLLLVSSSDDRTVRVWSREGKPLAVLTGHTGNVGGVTWSPDGQTLATGSADRTIRLWR